MPQASPARSRIALVVDDEPAVRDLISRMLSGRGWSVVQAPDADSAIAAAGSNHLGLLVTDYEMPAVTGLELATRLRISDRLLPVMMVSGRPDEAARILELPGGHTAFAVKPFALEDLVARIDALVGESWVTSSSEGRSSRRRRR